MGRTFQNVAVASSFKLWVAVIAMKKFREQRCYSNVAEGQVKRNHGEDVCLYALTDFKLPDIRTQ